MSGGNSFKGMSVLRKEEKKTEDKAATEKSKALQAYLASQYGAGPSAQNADKKKKKKKPKTQQQSYGAMRIVDQDISGFKSIDEPRRRQSDDDEDAPVIANIEEAEQLKLLVEREKQLFSKTADGSGWETVGTAQADNPAQPERRPRHESPDVSPPRRRARHDSPDNNDNNDNKKEQEGDASPPRRTRPRHDSPDATTADVSPPRRGRRQQQRHDSSSPDASPPRRRARHDSSADDASPPRRKKARHDSDNDDKSPADASPPRRRRHSSPLPPPAAADAAATAGNNLMSDGTRTGMISGHDLAAEMEKKRAAEAKRFASLQEHQTGRGAATVYRDAATGQRVTKEELLEKQNKEEKANQYEDMSALPWGGGLKQQAQAEEARRRLAEEAAKPFARGVDEEYDREERERLRFGDPMAHLVKRRQPELDIPPSLVAAQQDKLKKSGFVIPLEVPQHSWLRRGVGAPVNRYNIKPGRHWDGVDRSNGYERDMFKRQNELSRRAQESYREHIDDI